MSTTTGEDQAGVREEPARRSIPSDSFALRLKAVRLHAGDLTIEQAAAKAGFPNQSWGNWEHGKTPRDKADIVYAISEAFGIDRQWLMWGGPLAEPTTRRDRRGRRAPNSLNERYVIRADGGKSIGQSCPDTGGNTVAQRPRDTRPPGHPMITPRQSRGDLRWAA